jgi:diaminopimelate epimerase
MRIRFTKMQGAGNDFVVLDETRGLLGLTDVQYRLLANRHFGVGADQILSVRAAPAGSKDIDFAYAILDAFLNLFNRAYTLYKEKMKN